MDKYEKFELMCPEKPQERIAFILNEITKEDIFEMCMGFEEQLYNHELKEREIDYSGLKSFLNGTILKPYTEMLIEYQNIEFQWEECVPMSQEDNWNSFYKTNANNIKITELVLLLYNSSSSNHGIDISFSNVRQTVKINNQTITNTILDALITKYKQSKLDYSKMSNEEARENIIALKDKKWFKEYCFDSRIKHSELSVENPTEELVRSYAESHSLKREITKEFLQLKLKELEKLKPEKKVGTKQKNNKIASLALDLSYLIRIESFLYQNKCEHIFDFELSNETCRIIYDYLDYWGLIRDNLTGKNPSTRHSYIAAMIKQYKKPLENYERDYFVFQHEFKIDYLWKLCHSKYRT